ncbi:AbrB/MazE/SpoVT family DNA-binding domain-containing protein [Candidatus Micrarchaeota archaeon]|nr:AbrB/MazE/SpoVT family DNA-binding domain-containing protein [Candidatus Micrarchaeota archaeon]
MYEYVTKVTKKGQSTIPSELREAVGIELESEVVWFKEGHRLVIEPKKKYNDPLKELKKLNIRLKKSALELSKEAQKEFW